MLTPYKAARAAWHMAKFHRHLKNGAQFCFAHEVRGVRYPPPLKFRNGQVWHHGEHDWPFMLFNEIYMLRQYEPLNAPQNAIVFDIGANIGGVTMFWAHKRPDVTFHAYEPNPQAAATLRKNVAANALGKQVKVYQEALSGSREPIELWIDVPTILSTSYGGAPGYDGKSVAELGGKKISVPAVTPDDAWHRAGGWPIWMLKIDVEGAEGDILEAASDRMLASVRNACVEWHDNMAPDARKRCLARLQSANFDCRDEANPWVEGEGIIYASR